MESFPNRPPTGLRCSEADCGTTLPREYRGYLCPVCGNLLQAVSDPGPVSPGRLKEIWRERRASNHPLDSSGVWRFREFLPDTPEEAVVTLVEGNVPLLPGQKTAAYAGVEHLVVQAPRAGTRPGRSKIWG